VVIPSYSEYLLILIEIVEHMFLTVQKKKNDIKLKDDITTSKQGNQIYAYL